MEHPPHNSYQLFTFFFHALCPDVSPTCVSSFGSFLNMFLCLRLWRRHRDSATTRQGHLPLSSFEVDGVAWILNRGNFARSTGSMSMLLLFFNTWILSSYALLATWILVLLFMMLYEALDKNCHDFGRSTLPALILPSEDAPTMLSLSTRAWWGQWFQRISQMTILLCTYILTLWSS